MKIKLNCDLTNMIKLERRGKEGRGEGRKGKRKEGKGGDGLSYSRRLGPRKT